MNVVVSLYSLHENSVKSCKIKRNFRDSEQFRQRIFNHTLTNKFYTLFSRQKI